MAPSSGQSSNFDLRKRLWQRRRYDRLATSEKEAAGGEDCNPNPAGLGSSGGQDLNSNLQEFDAADLENEDLELEIRGESVQIEE